MINGLVTRRLSLATAGLALLLSACTTTVVRENGNGTTNAMAAIAPQLSVERFLQAVNANDFLGMAAIFGTVDGPVQGDATEVELRMSIIANILAHSDYRIVSEVREPGREIATQRISVQLTIGERVYNDVPFYVVQSDEGRWMIEQIDLEAVTGN